MRGAANALREYLRADRIPVTVINCGTLGDHLHDGTGNRIGEGIPWKDIARLMRCVLDMSRHAAIKEIDMPAMLDSTV